MEERQADITALRPLDIQVHAEGKQVAGVVPGSITEVGRLITFWPRNIAMVPPGPGVSIWLLGEYEEPPFGSTVMRLPDGLRIAVRSYVTDEGYHAKHLN